MSSQSVCCFSALGSFKTKTCMQLNVLNVLNCKKSCLYYVRLSQLFEGSLQPAATHTTSLNNMTCHVKQLLLPPILFSCIFISSILYQSLSALTFFDLLLCLCAAETLEFPLLSINKRLSRAYLKKLSDNLAVSAHVSISMSKVHQLFQNEETFK